MTHVFVDDGTDWLDRIRRCGYISDQYGAICSMPENNRVHDLPDTRAEQDEHRRRAGESETYE